MGTSFTFLYSFSSLFAIVSTIAAYILHKKTRALSTLIIFIGFLLGLISSIVFVVSLGFGDIKKYTEILTMVSYMAGPLTSIGFFIYAVKLKSEKYI